jgi:hypothetical protein
LSVPTTHLLRVLVEELVLLKQVVDHAREDLPLLAVAAVLELLQHLHNVCDALLGGVDLLEVLVCLSLHLRQQPMGDTR